MLNCHMPLLLWFCSTVVAEGYFYDDDNNICISMNLPFRFCRILSYKRSMKRRCGWSESIQPNLSHYQNDLLRLKSRSQASLCSNHGF